RTSLHDAPRGDAGGEREPADPPREPYRPLDVGHGHGASAAAQDRPVLDPSAVGEGAAEPYAERAREGRLDGTGVGARVLGRVRAPGPYGPARVRSRERGEYGGQPRPRPADDVVEAGGGPAVAA